MPDYVYIYVRNAELFRSIGLLGTFNCNPLFRRARTPFFPTHSSIISIRTTTKRSPFIFLFLLSTTLAAPLLGIERDTSLSGTVSTLSTEQGNIVVEAVPALNTKRDDSIGDREDYDDLLSDEEDKGEVEKSLHR